MKEKNMFTFNAILAGERGLRDLVENGVVVFGLPRDGLTEVPERHIHVKACGFSLVFTSADDRL